MNCKYFLSIVFGLLSFTLHAQGYTKNLARYLPLGSLPGDVVDALQLLSDTPSYYILEELYNGDTLTRSGEVYSYQNGVRTRFAMKKYEFDPDELTEYMMINDTFCIQTTKQLSEYHPYTDSTLVWWKNGRIYKASIIPYKGPRRDYVFAYENDMLVRQITDNAKFGRSEETYAYTDGRLSKMISQGLQSGHAETDYQCTDTLITMTSVSGPKDGVYHSKTLIRFDASGRITSRHAYMQRPDAGDFSLYQSEIYVYAPDGGYTMTATQHDQDNVNTLEFTPGDPAIERYTWKGSDQVWIRKKIRME